MGFLSNLFDSTKRSSSYAVVCPVAGELMDVSLVNDPAFSSKVMGDGVAIKPSEGRLCAPLSGTVEALFPTGHALAIKGDDGVSVLLHIGIDTVSMNGEGFTAHIAQGDRVESGQLLVDFDIAAIESEGFEATTMVLASEFPSGLSLCKASSGAVSQGDRVLWFE